jgi:Mg2+-importing ATPase
MTSVVMSIGVILPMSPVGSYLGFTPLPPLYWMLLALTLLADMLLTQAVKTWLIRRGWM